MSLLLIIISSVILSFLGVMGVRRMKSGQSVLVLGLLCILVTLPLGVLLPGLELHSTADLGKSTESFSWMRALLFIWVLGGAFMALKLLRDHRAYSVWAHSAVKVSDAETLATLKEVCELTPLNKPPSLFISSTLSAPVLGGIQHPTLFLPSGYKAWNKETLEMVFWHELGHLQRKDLWKNGFARVMQIFYWFNPFMRSLYQSLSYQCELGCDAWVMRHGVSRTQYLNALCDIAAGLKGELKPPLSLSMAEHARLAERVKNLVNKPVKRSPLFLGMMLIFLTILGLGIVSLKTDASSVSQSEVELRHSASPFPLDL